MKRVYRTTPLNFHEDLEEVKKLLRINEESTLITSFRWGSSPQGHGFWSEVYLSEAGRQLREKDME